MRQRLAATYFDTADLRLAAAGLTLRRRTGGDDAGWHLKVPAGRTPGRRCVCRRGAAARTVPAPLQQMVWAQSLGRRAAPGRRDRHRPDGAPAGGRDRAGAWPRWPTTGSRPAGCCPPTARGCGRCRDLVAGDRGGARRRRRRRPVRHRRPPARTRPVARRPTRRSWRRCSSLAAGRRTAPGDEPAADASSRRPATCCSPTSASRCSRSGRRTCRCAWTRPTPCTRCGWPPAGCAAR